MDQEKKKLMQKDILELSISLVKKMKEYKAITSENDESSILDALEQATDTAELIAMEFMQTHDPDVAINYIKKMTA